MDSSIMNLASVDPVDNPMRKRPSQDSPEDLRQRLHLAEQENEALRSQMHQPAHVPAMPAHHGQSFQYTTSYDDQRSTAQRKCPFKRSKSNHGVPHSQSMNTAHHSVPSHGANGLRPLAVASSAAMRRVKSDGLGADVPPEFAQSYGLLQPRTSNLSVVPEQTGPSPDIGELPSAYLERQGAQLSFLTPASNDWYSHSNSASPLSRPPSLYSGFSMPETSLPLSREASSYGLAGDVNSGMVRLSSHQSIYGQNYHHSPGLESPDMAWPTGLDKANVTSHSLFGIGGMDSLGMDSLGMDHDFTGLDGLDPQTMQRTDSASSCDSARSNASKASARSLEALARVNNSSKTPLVAKPTSSQQPSAAPKPAPGKAYTRPKKEKVFCDECPEGSEQSFRGEHELRRHKRIKHKEWTEKFMIVNAISAGRRPTVHMPKALKDCKHCSANKLYPQLHNATAHLRRCHFNPRGKDVDKDNKEKRGGKGGGKWPVMNEVNLWVHRVWVPAGMDGLPAHVTPEDTLMLDELRLKSKLIESPEAQPPIEAMLPNDFDQVSPEDGLMFGAAPFADSAQLMFPDDPAQMMAFMPGQEQPQQFLQGAPMGPPAVQGDAEMGFDAVMDQGQALWSVYAGYSA